MQILYRINRAGSTVIVATHDREMVDRMQLRVVQLHEGRIVRDQAGSGYTGSEGQTTTEFVVRARGTSDVVESRPSEAHR